MRLIYVKAAAFFIEFTCFLLASFAHNENRNLDPRRLESIELPPNISYTFDPIHKRNIKELNKRVDQLINFNTSDNYKYFIPNAEPPVRFYCFGIADNPVRTRIYEDRITCDIEGWNTLVTLSIPSRIVSEGKLQTINGCVGVAFDPVRTLYYEDEIDCNREGWAHLFELPTQESDINPPYINVWHANDPYRMTVAPPGYDLINLNWGFRGTILAYSITYPLIPSDLTILKPHVVKITDSHLLAKEFLLFGSLNLAPVQMATVRRSLTIMKTTRVAINDTNVIEVITPPDQNNASLYDIQIFKARTWKRGLAKSKMVTLHLRFDNITIAAVNIDAGVEYTNTELRNAFMDSLLNRESVSAFKYTSGYSFMFCDTLKFKRNF
jgi:hypothetical protein